MSKFKDRLLLLMHKIKDRIIKDNWLFKDLLQVLVIPVTGVIVTIIINNSQNENAERIAKNDQRLFAMQIFNDKLMGDRV